MEEPQAISSPVRPEPQELVRIIPDSSFLVALGVENDSHRQSAFSLLGALSPYEPYYYLYNLVIAETLNKLIHRKKISAAKAVEDFRKISKLLKNYKAGAYGFSPQMLFSRYKTFGRSLAMRKLDTNDFLIATEALSINAKIITNDAKMYRNFKKTYKGTIFFVTDRVEGIKNETPKLLEHVQQIVRTQ